MQYRNDKTGRTLSVLGYGCMRFTRKGAGIDLDKAEREVMAAINAGVNYFDTAYIYPGSEAALGEILERNHCRDRVCIASKLPQYACARRGGTLSAILPRSCAACAPTISTIISCTC